MSFDASTAPGSAMGETLRSADRVRARLEGAVTEVAGRFEASGDWAASGARSPGNWLCTHSDVSKAQAGTLLKTARLLRAMPVTADASRSGTLGSAKVHLLTRTRTDDVADEFDRQEAQLVDMVRGLSVDGARRYLEAWRIFALGDAADDQAEAGHGRDRLHISQGFAGRFVLDGDLCSEDGAILTGAVDAEIERWHHAGLLDDDTRLRSELRAAALIAIVRRGVERTDQNRDVRPLVLALIDASTLAGGTAAAPGPVDPDRPTGPHPSPGPAGTGTRNDRSPDGGRGHNRQAERTHSADRAPSAGTPISEIHGAGPVPAETIRRLLCEGDISRVVHNGASMPLDVGRRERLATAHQWRALVAVSGGRCEWPGCDAPHTWCNAHHVEVWNARVDHGRTDIDNLVLVCGRHHHLVHEGHHSIRRRTSGIEARAPDGATIPAPPLRHHPDDHAA